MHINCIVFLKHLNKLICPAEGELNGQSFRYNQKMSRRFLTNPSRYNLETFKIEKERDRPVFLPNLEGDSLAVLPSNLIDAVYLTFYI